ncbi:uncharacterized protein [Rutidosis leptorrhynchoides]|uniref:uncharacterized protein n=1 Tax=Rutidosis leptorrhynchoides TaxID=125765 RepID=UPI003A996141
MCWNTPTFSAVAGMEVERAISTRDWVWWRGLLLIMLKIRCTSNSKGKAKVAWKNVCRPKDQGGLGLKSLREWNETLIVKHIWRIIAQNDTLWGKWVNVVKLKDISFWDVEPKYDDSWGWKHLLNIKDKVKIHINVQSCNGINSYLWVDNAGNKVQFSSQRVWKDFRTNNNKVAWSHVIWFKQFDPKMAFILWLAVLKRLNTQDRIQQWMPNVVLSCVLCNKERDSIDHLFFSCEYSLKVWERLKSCLIFRGLPNLLSQAVQVLSQYPHTNNIWCILNRLVLAACVYYIWQERNHRVFKDVKRSANVLSDMIFNYVQMKMLTFKVKPSSAVIKAAKMWKLQLLGSRFVYM